MIYEGKFADINGKIYTVVLENLVHEPPGHEEDVHELILGQNPVTINTESDGLFSPIKSRGCTIEIVTNKYHFDFYSPKSREVSVLIHDENNNTIFRGWLTPNSYNQSYSNLDTIQLEAVEALSTLKDFRWKAYWNNLTEYLYAYKMAAQTLGNISETPTDDGNWHLLYENAQDLSYEILVNYSPNGAIIEAKDYISFLDLILLLLKDCGYNGNLYVHNSYTRVNGKSLAEISTELNKNIGSVLEVLYAAPSNFYDDDAERTPWTTYEILYEVMKFLNMSLIPYGDDVYLIDYRYLAEKKNTSAFIVYQGILLDTHNIYSTTALNSNTEIADIEAPGTPSLSIDDIYNKIEISSNLYTLDKISPDLSDEKNHISISEEMYLDENEWQWTKKNYKKFLWWEYDVTNPVTGYTYQRICRFNPKSGWIHHFYKHSNLSEIHYLPDGEGNYPTITIPVDGINKVISLKDKDYYDKDSVSIYGVNPNYKNGINQYCNTVGCLPGHYGYVKELGPNNLPTSFEWSDIMTFFIVDDTVNISNNPNIQPGNLIFNDILKLEKPVLEYTIDEEINYKPSTGTSWITISGELFYQYNNANYEIQEGKKTLKQSLSIVNENNKIYCTCPVDKAVTDLGNQAYCSATRKKTSQYYGMGFGCWKMSLQIGNKCWKDEWNPNTHKYESGWVDIEDVDEIPTFYIRYNNNPEENADEYVQAFSWMKTCANTNYKDKTGVDGYCIPIAADDPNAPSFGRLYLTIYTPTLIPDGEITNPFTQTTTDLRSFFFSMFNNAVVPWTQIPPVIFVKNFELGYVYTDENIWYKQQANVNTPDRVYSGNIDSENVNEFSDIEMKINTEHQSTPISRSYVATDNGYLHSLEHACTDNIIGQDTNDQIQEYNIIDAYIIHHSDRKPIYTADVDGIHHPWERFQYERYLRNENLTQDTSIPYDLIIDSFNYDLLNDKSTIKFISF